MKITEIISADKPSLSFEVFPPKKEDSYENVSTAVKQIAALKPSYMSVTYRAGGSASSDFSLQIAEEVESTGVTPLAHLNCITSNRDNINKILTDFRNGGIENILALRGDVPEGVEKDSLEFRYASDLVKVIKDFGGFCIGGACYPEGHPESGSFENDLDYLKAKVDSGCEFLTTQMFFDNNILYNFMYRAYKEGITVPVVAGIMPVTNPKSIKRICSISGTTLPQKFLRIVDRYGNNPLAMKQAGIAYATEQIIDLYANGINAVHIYSMNKPDVAEIIRNNIQEIIK
jgi:methylenetetrahydrofolate reductase (NADPH)